MSLPMKPEIHPKLHPAIFIDTSCGAEFAAMSTRQSKEIREIKGVPHFVHRIEISSASHPFYTGKHVLVDTARRAEKFAERAAKKAAASAARKGKKIKREITATKKAAKKATATKKKAENQDNAAPPDA